jgi:hypothetical protein
MDGLGSIGANDALKHASIDPKSLGTGGVGSTSTPHGPPAGFAIEAASIELSAKFNYVQLTAGANGDPAGNIQDLLDKLKQWVHDIFVKNGIEYQDLSPEEAQRKIAAGGDQSPEAVAKRIVDFVKGFANGTPEREQLLRNAVEQGFKAAEGEWGSKLPDISYKTMELVHAGLDELFKNQPAAAPATITAATTTPAGSAAKPTVNVSA